MNDHTGGMTAIELVAAYDALDNGDDLGTVAGMLATAIALLKADLTAVGDTPAERFETARNRERTVAATIAAAANDLPHVRTDGRCHCGHHTAFHLVELGYQRWTTLQPPLADDCTTGWTAIGDGWDDLSDDGWPGSEHVVCALCFRTYARPDHIDWT